MIDFFDQNKLAAGFSANNFYFNGSILVMLTGFYKTDIIGEDDQCE